MSDILLASLSDPESAAIDMIIRRNWPNLKTLRIRRNASLSIPHQTEHARKCKYCILDLFSVGLKTCSPESKARLQGFLAGRPAILISSAGTTGWTEAIIDSNILAIHQPYTSAQLLEALNHIFKESSSQETAPVKQPPMTEEGRSTTSESTMPAWRRALVLAEELQRTRPIHVALNRDASEVPPLAVESSSLEKRRTAIEHLTMAFPALRERPVLITILRLLKINGAIQVQLTRDVSLIGCIDEGWVATGISFRILVRMLAAPDMLSKKIEIHELPLAKAHELVKTRFGQIHARMRYPLDTLAWDVASARLKGHVFELEQDFPVILRRFPNFPQLEAYGTLDIQLAALCGRNPQSLSWLASRFPGREQDIYRFVTLGILSGALGIYGSKAPAHMHAPSASSGMTAKARRNFFRSLLDRLFQG